MSTILDEHQRRKREQELELARELKASYTTIEKSLVEEAERVLAEVPNNPAMAVEHKRVLTLLDDVRAEMWRYGEEAVKPIVAQGMVQSSYMGEQQSLDILRAAYPETVRFATLPVRSLNAFTKQISTGPLKALFDSFGIDASQKARKDILIGLSLGYNPRKVAATLRQSLGTNYTRSLLIARTETMRAHREGNRQSYRANSDLVTGWVWSCAFSKRTCAACMSLHGTEFPLDQPMQAHPACRCTMIPKTKTWKEMGYDIDEVVEVEEGDVVFARQSEEIQRAVLGNEQYIRYRNGEVSLRDFVGFRNNSWGGMYYKKVPK